MSWILLVLIYGAIKGIREIIQKKAMTKNSITEILVFYTLLSFIFVIPQAKDALGMEPRFYFLIALKSLIIFLAWICSFTALKRLPVSLYGILDMSGVLFATLLGVIFLGEKLGILQIVGLVTVCAGLLLLKFKPSFLGRGGGQQACKKSCQAEGGPAPVEGGQVPKRTEFWESQAPRHRHFIPRSQTGLYTAIAIISCLLNAVSGFMDKLFMRDVSTSQLQFWYLLFLSAYYGLYFSIGRIRAGRSLSRKAEEASNKSVVKNLWVWLLAILFVVGDKALFMANGIPQSSVSMMTLLKQSSCIVTIVGGRLFFKESDTGYRLFCAAVIISGIVLGTISG